MLRANAHIYQDLAETRSHFCTFANLPYAKSLWSLFSIYICMLDIEYDTLIDSGAMHNFVLQAFFDKLDAK